MTSHSPQLSTQEMQFTHGTVRHRGSKSLMAAPLWERYLMDTYILMQHAVIARKVKFCYIKVLLPLCLTTAKSIFRFK